MSWDDPGNWDTGSVPGLDDDAYLDIVTSSEVLLPAAGLTVDSINTHGPHLVAPSGTITTTGGLNIDQSTFDDGATIVGPAVFSGINCTLNILPTSGPALFDARAASCTIGGTITPQQTVEADGGDIDFAAGASK